MKSADFRFYAELNDFLPQHQKQTTFQHRFEGRVSVKHLIESFGVPHSEVDLVLVNSESVGFSYIVQDGDRISVYPIFESIDITPIGKLRPEPLRETCFIVDTHLGQLATYLRLIGFDTLYRNDFQDEEMAKISSDERRILLTKDRGLLKRNLVTHGYYIRETDPRQQLVDVMTRFDLLGAIRPFQRCLRCNGLLKTVKKEKIIYRLEANTRHYYDDFQICARCERIYWKGSHYKRMQHFLKDVLGIQLD